MLIRKFLSALTLVTLLSSIALMPVYADTYTKQSPGVYKLYDGSSLSGVFARGIDVSHYQKEIDWSKVAADDVSFIIHGVRYKGQPDPKFAYNMSEASKYGIKLGAYIYGYATTVEAAEAEADFVLNMIKDYPISYPIAYDVEDSGTQGQLPKEELSAIINAFMKKMRDAGYYTILYANDNWLANKIDLNAIGKPDVWVARYQNLHAYQNPVMWQATSSGSIDGIAGNVDIDFQYVDFSSKIPANTWRTIAGKTYYYKDYLMQKSTFINDGKASYYMNDEGLMYKGWLTKDGKSFYLDETSGIMSIGWKRINDKWHYFSNEGYMQTSWVKDNNTWYYLDNQGIMQTGWIKDNNKTYFLRPSGAMATGWINHSGIWYYMGADGAKTTGWQYINDKWYYLNAEGHMQTGVITLNNVSYFLSTNGDMLHDTIVDYNGKKYRIDSSGVMSEYKEEVQTAPETTAQGSAETAPAQNPGASTETKGTVIGTNPPATTTSDTQVSKSTLKVGLDGGPGVN